MIDRTQPAIRATGLRKSFGKQKVLDGVDLAVATGTVYSLLGPNGAGKTTTVHIFSTLISFDSGDVRVAGKDPVREPESVRAAIGVTGQFSAVDNFLTGEENLQLMADLRRLPRSDGRKRVSDLLEQFDLADAARKVVSTYSGGMKRRLDLAMTLIGNPRIIFLDEPTTGLDPRSRRMMWRIVRELANGGVTIFLTTQYLEEADQLSDRIGVLDRGRIVAEGTPAELKRLVPGGHISLRFGDAVTFDRAARLLAPSSQDSDALTMEIPAAGDVGALRNLLDRLDGAAIEPEDLAVHTPDLEDVFLALTGRPEEKEVVAR
jgi:ABC-2 type transport system ATP-binding protein